MMIAGVVAAKGPELTRSAQLLRHVSDTAVWGITVWRGGCGRLSSDSTHKRQDWLSGWLPTTRLTSQAAHVLRSFERSSPDVICAA